MTSPVLDREQRAEAARAARREEILGAARAVFAERGFRGTTVADIADAAGIALGTIYLYFPSKEAVFAALHQRFQEIIGDALREDGISGTVEENARRAVNNVFRACGENRDLIRLVVLNSDPESDAAHRMREAADERDRPLVRVFEAGRQAGVLRNEDAVVMARLIQGLVSIAVYQAYVISDGSDADRMRDACADMVVAYLQPPAMPEQKKQGASPH